MPPPRRSSNDEGHDRTARRLLAGHPLAGSQPLGVPPPSGSGPVVARPALVGDVLPTGRPPPRSLLDLRFRPRTFRPGDLAGLSLQGPVHHPAWAGRVGPPRELRVLPVRPVLLVGGRRQVPSRGATHVAGRRRDRGVSALSGHHREIEMDRGRTRQRDASAPEHAVPELGVLPPRDVRDRADRPVVLGLADATMEVVLGDDDPRDVVQGGRRSRVPRPRPVDTGPEAVPARGLYRRSRCPVVRRSHQGVDPVAQPGRPVLRGPLLLRVRRNHGECGEDHPAASLEVLGRRHRGFAP
ncbi:unannotated protein [freshwater metagenome]|uniref:Unannotated protein n=1 Tax=freshwater metagenome TaxID=449393 RepID=A0A6J6Z5A3_9ZZZZ